MDLDDDPDFLPRLKRSLAERTALVRDIRAITEAEAALLGAQLDIPESGVDQIPSSQDLPQALSQLRLALDETRNLATRAVLYAAHDAHVLVLMAEEITHLRREVTELCDHH